MLGFRRERRYFSAPVLAPWPQRLARRLSSAGRVLSGLLNPSRWGLRQQHQLRMAPPYAVRESAMALLAGLMALLTLARLITGFFWDIPLSTDEAQYLAWSRDLQAGYYSKPPFIAWALSLTNGVCQPTLEGCVRMLQPLAALGATLALMASAHLLYRQWVITLWSGALFLSLPLLGFYAQVASTDAWLLLWWSLALLGMLKALQQEYGPRRHLAKDSVALGWWVSCGLAIGLGLLTKYSMALFVVSMAWVLWAERRLFTAGPWLAGFVALIVFLPNLFWNLDWGFPTVGHHLDITVGQQAVVGPAEALTELLSFFASQWLVFGPLVFGALLLGTGRWLVQRLLRQPSPYASVVDRGGKIGLAMAWPILLVTLLQAATSRAHANWAAPAAVGICLAVPAWWLAHSAHRGSRVSTPAAVSLWASLLLGLMVSLVVLTGPWLVPALGLSGSRSTDPYIRLTGPKAVALSLAEVQPQAFLSNDRRLLASLAAYRPEAQVLVYQPLAELRRPGWRAQNHWQLQHNLLNQPADQTGTGPWLLLAILPKTVAEADWAEGLGPDFAQVSLLSQTSPALARRLSDIAIAGKTEERVVAAWVRRAPTP